MELVACPVRDGESLVEFTSGMVVRARFQYLLEVVLLALCPRTNAPAPGASRSVVGVHHVLRWFLASQGGGGPAMYRRGRILVPPTGASRPRSSRGDLACSKPHGMPSGGLATSVRSWQSWASSAEEHSSLSRVVGRLPPAEFETQERETDAAWVLATLVSQVRRRESQR